MSTYLATHVGGVPTRNPLAGVLSFLQKESRAACEQLDPEEFFRDSAGSYPEDVFIICAGCPIRDACLDWALSNNEEWGVWGGTTPDDRRELKGQRPKYRRRQRSMRPVSCDHRERRHYAHGMCEPCYRRKKYQETAGLTAECVNCREHKRIYAIGLCGACYMRHLRAAS